MVKVYQLDTDCDLSIMSLKAALEMMKEDGKKEDRYRLIAGRGYREGQILEIIFNVSGKLDIPDIPFEQSYCLDEDAWIVVRDRDCALFYGPGA